MPFDPSTAQLVGPSGGFDSSTAMHFDPTTATPAAPKLAPGATGLSMVGEMWNDLTGGTPPTHAPNALEQGIVDLNNSPIVRGLHGSYMQAVANSPITTGVPSPIRVGMALAGNQKFAQSIPMGTLPGDVPGIRDVMEQAGIGRRPGESDAAFHQRYTDVISNQRQSSANEVAANQVGQPAPGQSPTLGQRAAQLGQGALNMGAGIVGSPEYFLLPGGGVGGSVAKRIAGSVASNAGIGAASDAAAQAMDITQGQKKDFDIEQNLKSAAVSGAFGGLVHGATEVAPFVKGLFGERGVDTTPQADPRPYAPKISPMTTDRVKLNQADAAQYQQLLQSGSVDDIKQFFQGRNGPQPSWTDVSDWVSHRDSPPVTINGQVGPDPTRQPDFNYEQAYNDHAISENRQAVENHVNQQMAGWANAPSVEVVHGPGDIADPAMRAQALAADVPGGEAPGAKGFYGEDGITRMYAGRISSPEDANALLYHEGLGHYGLAQKFGDKLDSVLGALLDRNVNQLSVDTDQWMKDNPGAYGGDRLRAAEEVLAERSEKGAMPKSWQNAVTSSVMQFGRKMGLKLAYTDAEVNHILAMAHDAVINGKPDVRANGFQGTSRFKLTSQPVENDTGNFETVKGRDFAGRPYMDVRPTEKLMPGSAAEERDNYGVKTTLRDGQHQVTMSVLPKELRGQEYGREMYRTADEEVQRMTQGKQRLASDSTVSAKAARLWEVAGAERHPLAETKVDENGVYHEMPWASHDSVYSNPNKFMFASKQARDFDPHDAGTFRASDGNPRFEITDHDARLGDPNGKTLGEVLHHDELFRQYPELRDMLVREETDPKIAGRYVPGEDKHISLNPRDPDRLATILHETQHAIQDIEQHPDFVSAKGSNKMSMDEYMSHPSEVEAYATEDRRNMTMRERDSNPIKFMRARPTGPKDVAEEAYDRLSDGYAGVTRSWDHAMLAAKNTALDTDKLKQVRSVGDLDKRLFQYDNAAKQLNDKIMEGAQKIRNGEELTDEEHADQLKNLAQFHYILGRIENDSAQIARALNAMKVVEFSRNNLLRLRDQLAEADSTLAGLADPDTMNRFLRQYEVLGNTKGGQILARDMSKPGWEKYALSLYRNMLLSGLGTHIKAPMDMATGISLDLEDRLAAIPIGKIHDGLQALGLTKQGGIHGRESLGYVYGVLKAITNGEAWGKAMAAFDDPHAQTKRMSNEAPAVLPGMLGKITSFPTRLISAQDGYFRAISTQAHLYGSGIAKSIEQGGNLSWADHITRGSTMAANPSDAMRFDAEQRANKALLLSDNPLTNFLERGKQIKQVRTDAIKQGIVDRAQNVFTKADQALQADPTNPQLKAARETASKTLWKAQQNIGAPDPVDRALTAVIDLFTPIIRVPANSLMSRVIARSPLSFVDPETRAMFQAGGRQADIALARTLTGTMKLAMYWAAADVAGNAFTSSKRTEKEAVGWRPNSVKESDGTYSDGNQLAASINPFDKHNSTATMVADIREASEKGANGGMTGTALQAAGTRVMTDMFNEVWMGDLSKAAGMFSENPSEQGSSIQNGLGRMAAATAVPQAIAQFRGMSDPYQRDVSASGNPLQAVGNMIENRIPGMSQNLPMKYSVYGDPMVTGSSIIGTHNALTGGNQTHEDIDPAKQELERLSDLTIKDGQRVVHDGANALVTPVKGTIPRDPYDSSQGTIQLTEAQKQEYQRVAGVNIVALVKQAMQDGSWDKMSDADKVEEVRSIESDMKKAAAEYIRSTIK